MSTKKRPSIGYVQFNRPERGWRVAWFVMGGSVRIREDEWLTAIFTSRPVQVSCDGMLAAVIPTAPTEFRLLPGQLMGKVLRFNRITVR